MNEALGVISSEISDPFKFGRIEKRLRGTFEYYIRAACDRRRTSRSVRQAMKFFDDKNAAPQPFSEFGITVPDFDTLMNASPTSSSPSQPRPERAQDRSLHLHLARAPPVDGRCSRRASRTSAKGQLSRTSHAPDSVPANLNNQPTSDFAI